MNNVTQRKRALLQRSANKARRQLRTEKNSGERGRLWRVIEACSEQLAKMNEENAHEQ